MVERSPYSVLRIRKRAWYIWLLRVLWLVWLVFWADVAIGSWKEMEQRALFISLAVFLVSLILGFLLWLWGYMRFKKVVGGKSEKE